VKSKYRKLKLGRGRTLDEHRHVMQRAVGRPLASKEVVHHINGDGHDNRLENLQVMPMSEHARLHAIKKLTESAVIEIRASQKSLRWLAAFYGVHQQTIWAAKHGRTWSHIPVPKIEPETSKTLALHAMKYVTVAMIAKHARRHPETVRLALHRAQIPIEIQARKSGIRVLRKDADRFLAFWRPEIGPLPKPTIEEVATR
jgi:hypothetical protein